MYCCHVPNKLRTAQSHTPCCPAVFHCADLVILTCPEHTAPYDYRDGFGPGCGVPGGWVDFFEEKEEFPKTSVPFWWEDTQRSSYSDYRPFKDPVYLSMSADRLSTTARDGDGAFSATASPGGLSTTVRDGPSSFSTKAGQAYTQTREWEQGPGGPGGLDQGLVDSSFGGPAGHGGGTHGLQPHWNHGYWVRSVPNPHMPGLVLMLVSMFL